MDTRITNKNKNKKLTYSIVIEEIEKLLATSESGTLYLINDKNAMGQILITKGNIVAALCGRNRGMHALETMRESSHFTLFNFKSHDRVPLESEANLSNFSTVQILMLLKSSEEFNKTKIIRMIIEELTLHLGPLAELFCEKHLNSITTKSDAILALNDLSINIENKEDSIEFKRLMLEKIVGNNNNNNKFDLTEYTQTVTTELTQYIGPIASVMSKEHLKGATNLDDIKAAINNLTKVIDYTDDRVKIKHRLIELIPDDLKAELIY